MSDAPANEHPARPLDDDAGAALPLIALMMVTLIGLSAFAIDLGWIYLSSSRIQRAADAAALAGVVYLPGDTANVTNFTVNGADANGYSVGTVIPNGGSPVNTGGGSDTLTWTALADNRLEVTLDSSVRSFFLRVLGFESFDISRTATAEYIKPVPIGSPDPCFGIGSTSIEGEDCNPATAQRFWAAISGPYTNKFNGDQRATRWWDSATCGGCWNPPENINQYYRPEGYYLAIDVPDEVSDLDVDIYDAGFYDRGSFDFQTGDLGQNTGGGAHTHYQLYWHDSTPLDPTDNVPISGCRFDINSGSSASTYRNQWRQLCSFDPDPGIYVLRVWTTGNIGGTNQYGVRATTQGGGNARVYGINDISIFTNQTGVSTLSLAEVVQEHAGKVLEIELYDPGEDDANAYMTVKTPGGSTATCTWASFDENENQTDSDSGSCRIQTSDGNSFFNGELLKIQIDIPDSYTCSADCWWKMEIENSQPHDRTTWAARVIGNPVRLTPNT